MSSFFRIILFWKRHRSGAEKQPMIQVYKDNDVANNSSLRSEANNAKAKAIPQYRIPLSYQCFFREILAVVQHLVLSLSLQAP